MDNIVFGLTRLTGVSYPSAELEMYFFKKHAQDYNKILKELCIDSRHYESINRYLHRLYVLNFKAITQSVYSVDLYLSQLQLGFKHDSRLIATAEHYNNVDYIIISFGYIFKIEVICQSLFMTNNFMQSIGKPSKSDLTLSDIGGFITLIMSGFLDSFGTQRPYRYFDCTDFVQRCAERYNFALSVSECIMFYTLLHEFGHHEKGHVFYMKNRMSISEIHDLELNIKTTRKTDGKIPTKYLEFDADRYAIATMLKFRKDLGYNHLTYSDQEWLKVIATAISIVHRLFDYSWPTNISSALLSHPSPLARSSEEYISLCCRGNVDDLDFDTFQSIYREVNGEIESSWKDAGMFENSLKGGSIDAATEAAYLWKEYEEIHKSEILNYALIRQREMKNIRDTNSYE